MGMRMKKVDFTRYLKLSKYLFFDAIMIAVSYFIAIFMFMVLEIELHQDALLIALPSVIVFKLIIFYAAGLYRMLENHVGFEDVIKITIVSIISNAVIVGFIEISGILFMYKSAYFFITITEIGLVKVEEVIIAINNYDKKKMRELINLVTEKNVRIKRLISMSDVEDKPQIIDVKIEDLLNRDEIKLR
jgi:FlaA1/EpsC-like NDP-sugar epimerase